MEQSELTADLKETNDKVSEGVGENVVREGGVCLSACKPWLVLVSGIEVTSRLDR